MAVQGLKPAVSVGFTTPAWVKDAIFYQVFPDRFFNGDKANDPADTQAWGSRPTNEGFMGGDLEGLRQKLDYLGDLGVTGIYLNPIFSSPSNHGYNITDYFNVEQRLGGNQAFKGFITDAKARKMRVMLDGVFNHTSHEHEWFKDVRDKGPESPYWSFYDVKRHPIRYSRDADGVLRSPDYRSWWDYATLPELWTTRDAVRDIFLRSPNSVAKHWIKEYGIDGWRMDVADEVEMDFWREARKEIKKTNPDTWMVAENWHDASHYLQGDQFDGAMNYRFFQQPAVKYFAKKEISSDEFVKQVQSPYPHEARFAMFNHLGSHDTPRFVTEASGDWYRMRPAAIFQMTWVGVPVIYYGDEIGMDGGKDPECRKGFAWDQLNHSSPAVQLRSLYKTLIDTRKGVDALRRGTADFIYTHNDNKMVAFRRHSSGDPRDAVVVLNNDVKGHDNAVIPVGGFAADGTAYRDAISGKTMIVSDGTLKLGHMQGNWGAVLVRELPGSLTAYHSTRSSKSEGPTRKAGQSGVSG